MSVTVQGRVPREWGDSTVSHLTRRLQALERALASGADLYLAPSVPTYGSGTITGGAGTTAPTPPGATPAPEPEVEVFSEDAHPHIHMTHEIPYLADEIRRLAEVKPHIHVLDELPSLLEEIRRIAETKPHTHILDDVHGAVDDAERVIAGQMFGG